MLIYPSARSQLLACIWIAVYLLNVTVQRENARVIEVHPLILAVRNEMNKGTTKCSGTK